METPFPSFEPNGPNDEARGPRLREIPLRLIVPNMITVLAICAGLSGIRLAFENRFELAVAMVLVAAFLDGIDGRVARLMKATSKFGAQMDSLADIVNFGVAPALVLYAFVLDQARSLGWIAALIYVIAAGLRLARFNVMAEREVKASWQSEYFVGVPAPAGAMLVLLPMYLGLLGLAPDRSCRCRFIGLYGADRLPAGQPSAGLVRQIGKPRPPRSRPADHPLRRALCRDADELHLGDHGDNGCWLSASACRSARASGRRNTATGRSIRDHPVTVEDGLPEDKK